MTVKRFLGVAFLAAGALATRAAEPAFPINNATACIARLSEFDRTMDQYFRNDSLTKAKDTINVQLKQYNDWVHTYQATFEAEAASLKERAKALDELTARVHDMAEQLNNQPPNRANRASVDAYNKQVVEYNALAKQQQELVSAYNNDARAHHERHTAFEREAELGRLRLKRNGRTATVEVGAQEKWLASTEASKFFTDLNHCYAALRRESSVRNDPALTAAIEKAAGMRRELGDWFQVRQREDEAGHLLVEATFCRREKCRLILDTGARSVSISSAMVEALGLTDRLGKEVEVGLGGGLRTTGRRLVIPQISVLGQEAQDVEAVMLEEPGVGVDGLLGLTFLRRLNYRIEYGDTPTLVLEQKRPVR